MRMNHALLAAVAASVFVAGCNGGGGGGDSQAPAATVSSASFPLAKANADYLTNGARYTLAVSGKSGIFNLSGSLAYTAGNAAPSTLNGASTLSVSASMTGLINSSNGSSSQVANTAIAHYNPSNYMLIAVDGGNSTSEVVTSGFAALPTSVKVGDTGRIGTADKYSDNTLRTKTATCVVSFVIEPRNESSVTVNHIDECKGVTSSGDVTGQTRYSLDATGKMALLSMTLQTSDGTQVLTVQ